MGFSRQEYWSGKHFPSPEDLPNPGIKFVSPALQADPLPSEPPGKPLAFYGAIHSVAAAAPEFVGNPESPLPTLTPQHLVMRLPYK